MENLHLKNLDQYSHLKTPKQAQNMMLYHLLQISNNINNIHNINRYIKPQLFIKAFPNITYCNQAVDENNIQFILEPIQLYLFELMEQKKYFQINIKEKLNNILNEYDDINYTLKNDPRIDYSDIYKIYDNEVVLNNTINKNQIYDEYQSFQDWIYTDSAKEIINNKFKIIKYFIPKNIYIEKIRQKTNEISNIGQTMSSYRLSSYRQEKIIKEILKK
jgi:hypothetical protein